MLVSVGEMAEIDGKWKTEERARLAGSYNLCVTGICTGKYYRPLRFQISAATEELTLFILFLPWIKRHPGISTGRETSVSLNLDTVVSPLPSCTFLRLFSAFRADILWRIRLIVHLSWSKRHFDDKRKSEGLSIGCYITRFQQTREADKPVF